MAPQDDGQPLRAHLESYERQTGKTHELLLDAPELPESCALLWRDFLDLHGSRGSTGMGPMRITFSDIAHWQDIRQAKFGAWEIDAIRKADDAYLEEQAKWKPPPSDGQ